MPTIHSSPQTLALVGANLSALYWQSPEETALTLALSLRLRAMALALLAHVAQTRDAADAKQIVDRPNFRKWTPLMIAARDGNLDVVKVIIRRRREMTGKAGEGAFRGRRQFMTGG